MTTLLNIALINAVTVLPLALLACLVGRWARRPALTHALWVLVLLKFVTPPLFNLPVTIEVPVAAETRNGGADAGPVSNVLAPASTRHDSSAAMQIDPAPRPETLQGEPPVVATTENRGVGRDTSSVVTKALQTCSTYWAKRPGLQSLLLGCWLAGAALWVSLQIVRAARFQRRVLRDAIAPVELQEQTRRLALRLGLRRAPRVLIVNATVSPMLWGCGSRATLLFPSDLADRLNDDARATLLTHELAHFGRGDHWVRLVELVVGGLFWWHPVVWWARRQIEEAEEECCDAWVIGEFPNAPRQYAEALLDTIDFLCESREALPPIASGLGHAHFLRHRLTKIMRGAAPKSLSHRSRWSLALVAALLLPLQPFAFGSSSLANLRLDSIQPFTVGSSVTTESSEDASGTTPIGPTETTPAVESSVGTRVPPSARPRLSGEQVLSNAVSPDGRFVVRRTTARRVVLADLTTNVETDLSEERITAVAFAPDGDWFVAAGQDGRVTVWDSLHGKMLRTVLKHGDLLRSVAVSPRGDTIAVGGRDGAVLICDFVTGQPVVNVPGYSSEVTCVRFSSNGRQLAVAVGDWMSNSRGEVALLDAGTGKTITTLECATSPAALAFASNDELIVGLWDGRTQLWNLVNRQVIGTAMANKNNKDIVAAATFSPDTPVLREVTFVAQDPSSSEEPSPLSLLRGLFASPANP
ncbi:MAG: M56 family metallopeptidase [Planctomycetota bacterium]